MRRPRAQVLSVEAGDTDVDGIRAAIAEAQRETSRPTLIKVHTTLGFGSPNLAGTMTAHGKPMGEDEGKLVREQLGWPHGEFVVPGATYQTMRDRKVPEGADAEAAWREGLEAYRAKHPDEAAAFDALVDGGLPAGWEECLPSYTHEDDPQARTRAASAGPHAGRLVAMLHH